MQQFELAEAYTQLSIRGQGRFHADLRNVRERLRRTQQHMDQMAVAARRMLLVGGAAFGLAVRQAMNFEHAVARVSALTGATATQFARLTTQARELGATTQFTASQSAQAMSAFALAGFDVNKIMTSMEPTLNLAAAGQLEIGQAADIAAKIMAGMKMEADELTHATDVLAKAFTTANTDLVQLGEAMKHVGTVGRVADKDLEELVAIIQVLSNVGIQSSMAGTSLRNILARLAKEGKEVKTVFGSLNVQIKNAQGYIRPLADIVDDFSRALQEQGREAEAMGMAMTAFGQRAGPAFAALLGEGGKSIREYEKQLKDAGGTAERIAKIQMDTLKGSTIALKSAIESLAISIGEIYSPTLRSLADDMRDVAQASSKMDNVTKRNIATWSEFGLQAGIATIAGAKLLGVLTSLGGLAGAAVAGGAGAAALYGTAASRAARDPRQSIGFGQKWREERLRMTEQIESLIPGSTAQYLRREAAIGRRGARATTAAHLTAVGGETPVGEQYKLEAKAVEEAQEQIKRWSKEVDDAAEAIKMFRKDIAEKQHTSIGDIALALHGLDILDLRAVPPHARRAEFEERYGPKGMEALIAGPMGAYPGVQNAQQALLDAQSRLASAQARLAEHTERATAAAGPAALEGLLGPEAFGQLAGFLGKMQPQAPPPPTLRGTLGAAWGGVTGAFGGMYGAAMKAPGRLEARRRAELEKMLAEMADMDAMRMAREAEVGPGMMARLDLQERAAKQRALVEKQYQQGLGQLGMGGVAGTTGFAAAAGGLQQAVSAGERQMIRLDQERNRKLDELNRLQRENMELLEKNLDEPAVYG